MENTEKETNDTEKSASENYELKKIIGQIKGKTDNATKVTTNISALDTKSALQNFDKSQNKLIADLSGQGPWNITKAWEAAKLHRETIGILKDRIENNRKKQQLNFENANKEAKLKIAELRLRQAEKKAEEAKSLARKWGRWLSAPFVATGEGIAAILKGIGEGAGKALAGIYYGIKERRMEHKERYQRESI